MLSFVQRMTGDFTRARPRLERALRIFETVLGANHPSTFKALYNLACIASLEKDRETAINYLQQLLERGYMEPDLAMEVDFMFLYGDPEFEAILAEVQSRYTGNDE